MSRRSRRSKSTTQAIAPPHTGRPLEWLLAIVVLAGLTWFVFGQTRTFTFVNWDDQEYITNNEIVREGLTRRGMAAAFTANLAGNWQPVTALSHQIDVQLFGLDAGAHHLMSVAIHFANGLLLLTLLYSLTRAPWRSAFVAAIFLVHPLHVESVAWVAERKDVLCALFSLLTMLGYVAYVRTPGAVRYVLVIGLFALALMAKPMAVSLPFLLLLLDVWPLKRLELTRMSTRAWTRPIVEKIPLVAMAAALGVITLMTQSQVGAVANLTYTPLPDRIVRAIVSYATYVWKTFWPIDLIAFYPRQPISTAALAVSVVVLAGVTAFVIRERSRRPFLLVGWAWFVVSLAPVIGIIQVGDQAMADRYMYVPMIGLLVATTWGISSIPVTAVGARRALGLAAVIIVVSSAATARVQAAQWKDSITLWRHATNVVRANQRALENLGTALREAGDLEGAALAYNEAIRLAPRYAVLRNSLGLVLVRQGRLKDAIDQFTEAVSFDSAFVEARSNLGNALAADGELDQAVAQYSEAVRLKPTATDARIGLGSTLLRLGRPTDAQSTFEEVIRLAPDVAEAHNGLGAALATQGKHDAAIPHYREAVRLKPTLVNALTNLALSLVAVRDTDEARRCAEEALKVDPTNSTAQKILTSVRGR